MGGLRASGWVAAGTGIIGGILTGGAIVGTVFSTDFIQHGSTIRIGDKDEIRYSGSVSRQQAQALAGRLKEIGYFTNRGAEVLLKNDNAGRQVSFVVQDGAWDEPETLASFEEIGRAIAPSVGGFPLKIELMNTGLTVKTDSVLGKLTYAGEDTLYYSGSATDADAKSVGNSLKSARIFTGQSTVVFLSKHLFETAISFVVKDGTWDDPSQVRIFERIVRQVAGSAGELPIRLRLLNTSLQLQKEIIVQRLDSPDIGLINKVRLDPGLPRP
jgi:hypothetical protein